MLHYWDNFEIFDLSLLRDVDFGSHDTDGLFDGTFLKRYQWLRHGGKRIAGVGTFPTARPEKSQEDAVAVSPESSIRNMDFWNYLSPLFDTSTTAAIEPGATPTHVHLKLMPPQRVDLYKQHKRAVVHFHERVLAPQLAIASFLVRSGVAEARVAAAFGLLEKSIFPLQPAGVAKDWLSAGDGDSSPMFLSDLHGLLVSLKAKSHTPQDPSAADDSIATLAQTISLLYAQLLKEQDKTTQVFNNWHHRRMLAMLRFLDKFDKQGGLYYYRWGDAELRTLWMSLFVYPRQIRYFSSLGYQHYHNFHCPAYDSDAAREEICDDSAECSAALRREVSKCARNSGDHSNGKQGGTARMHPAEAEYINKMFWNDAKRSAGWIVR